MAGMELPLIGPSGGQEIEPLPVVAPHNEAWEHLASAGENMQHDALNLWYMGRMARQNEQQAKIQDAQDAMDTADWKARTKILQSPDLRPEQMGEAYRHEMTSALKPTFDSFQNENPALRDRLLAMGNKTIDNGAAKMVYQATAEGITRSDAAFKSSINRTANALPYLDKDVAARRTAEMLSGIDTFGHQSHLSDPEIQDIKDRFIAQGHLSYLQKAINEAPGSTLAQLTSKDFDQNNPWMGQVGGEKMKAQLIAQAQSTIKNQDATAIAAFNDQRTKDVNQLTAMKAAGQQISDAMLDNMHTISAQMKEYFKPTYRPQPAGDEGLLQQYMGQIDSIKDASDGMNLQLNAIASRSLNPNQMQQLNKAVQAQVRNAGTALGQANAAALRSIDDHFNPVPKHPYEILPTKAKFNAEISRRAQEDFKAAMYKFTDPAEAIHERDLIIEKYDKHAEKTEKVNATKAAATPPPVAPTSAATMSDTDLVMKLGLH